jgi:hypothetical protein
MECTTCRVGKSLRSGIGFSSVAKIARFVAKIRLIEGLISLHCCKEDDFIPKQRLKIQAIARLIKNGCNNPRTASILI